MATKICAIFNREQEINIIHFVEITYSFIIPHKNAPRLLRRCVDSIPRRDDIQIIVVDDDSKTDIVNWGSFDWGDQACIELICTHGLHSAGAVRNEGLKCAKGKWLLFADCDDYYKEGFINKLDNYKNGNFDAIFFGFEITYNGVMLKVEKSTPHQRLYLDYEQDKNKWEEIRYIKSPWVKMVSKDFINKYHIQFEDVILGNDVWFSYQVGFYTKKYMVLTERLYVYNVHSKSISRERTVDKDVVQIETYVKQNAFFNFIGHPEWHINLPGWIKYHWKKSHHKFKYTIALLANSFRIYKIRNRYVDGIKQRKV